MRYCAVTARQLFSCFPGLFHSFIRCLKRYISRTLIPDAWWNRRKKNSHCTGCSAAIPKRPARPFYYPTTSRRQQPPPPTPTTEPFHPTTITMNQPPSACAACRLCNVLFDDLDDARHHFSTAPHPIRAKDRRELGPREISHLIDSRIQVMALSDPSATSAWINSADAADAMQRVVRNPSVFEDPAVRSQMRDMAQTPARRGAQVCFLLLS